LCAWWYLDVERGGPDGDEAAIAADLRAMIEQFDAAAADAGLSRAVHCLVIPHKHFTTQGINTDDAAMVDAVRYRRAAFSVADDPAFDHVAAFSILDATDGMWFDGRPEAAAWLVARGYDAFEYGIYTGADAIDLAAAPDFFDSKRLHPSGQHRAAFFASFLAAAVPGAAGGCPADLDGDGTAGFADLVVLLADWGPCRICPADLDGDGEVGFPDLVELLAAWGPCPG